MHKTLKLNKKCKNCIYCIDSQGYKLYNILKFNPQEILPTYHEGECLMKNNTLLSEEQVLKKLNVPDFRHVSKDKIMTLLSSISEMDPEVAKKVIEQFPTYASSVKEILSDYKVMIDTALVQCKESTTAYYGLCNTIVASLSSMLEKDTLSFEEKKYVIDKMLVVEGHMNNKDTETKGVIKTVVTVFSTTIGVAFLLFAAVLGASSGISLPNGHRK
jgi:hypothetical protein